MLWARLHESSKNFPELITSIQASTCNTESNIACDKTGTQRPTLSGSFYGAYDLDDVLLKSQAISPISSYFLVDWSKDPQSGSWLFHHVLRVNHKYPWLMLYLRADATHGLSAVGDSWHDDQGARVSKFQGEVNFGCCPRGRLCKPVLPFGHWRVLEKRRIKM